MWRLGGSGQRSLTWIKMESVWVTSACRHVTSLSASKLLWCHVWCNTKNLSAIRHHSTLVCPPPLPLEPTQVVPSFPISVGDLRNAESSLLCTVCFLLQDVKLQHLTWFIVVLWLRLQHHHYLVFVCFSSPTLPAHLGFVRLMLIFDLRHFPCLFLCCPLVFMMLGHEWKEMFHHNDINVFLVKYLKRNTEAELVK